MPFSYYPNQVNELRQKATTFMGVSKDAARSPEDVMSTPLPGETLAMFYARTRASLSAAQKFLPTHSL